MSVQWTRANALTPETSVVGLWHDHGMRTCRPLTGVKMCVGKKKGGLKVRKNAGLADLAA